jgi:hypothetical protein
MNPFFSSETRETPVPRGCYAKLDQTEPQVLEDAHEAVFAFEAVDVDWEAFGVGKPFDLKDHDRIRNSEVLFWSLVFGGRTYLASDPDPYEGARLFRLELTVERGDPLFDTLVEARSDWLRFDFDRAGQTGEGREVVLFGGLFATPATVRLAGSPRQAPTRALDAVFDMKTWPNASRKDVEDALRPRCAIEHLAVFDVGQGSANALLCPHGIPQLYFDLGAGVYRNAGTRPNPPVRFCHCENAPVIMSHWDADHWTGGKIDPKMLRRVWIAPRQSIGSIHKTFGTEILKAGGRILIVEEAGPFTVQSGFGQTLSLRRGSGDPDDRNASGLWLFVEDHWSHFGWLLTGDAAYRYLDPAPTIPLSAVIAPHHGADMGKADRKHVPRRPPKPAYARAAFSFGPENKHGGSKKAGRPAVQHPTFAAIKDHIRAGWDPGFWLCEPGDIAPQRDFLATAENGTPSHLGGAVIGWSGKPSTSAAVHCHAAGTCNTSLPQS